MKKILLIVLFFVLGVVVLVFLPSKNTKKISIDSSKGGQLIRLDTDGLEDDLYSSVRIRLKGELSEDSEVFLSRSDNLMLEREMDIYSFKFRKGIIDTTFQGDWYTNKARLHFKFSPKSKGIIEGYLTINN
ncbi:MAG: hypothetical protein V4585_14515 [Bacteroidota bacterium]|jgi:hypothetical protein